MEEIDYGLIPDWLKDKLKSMIIDGAGAAAKIFCKKFFPDAVCDIAIAAIKGAIKG